MTIRRATLDDVPALTAFGRRIFGATFGPDNEPANLSAYLDQAYDEGRQREEVSDPRIETLLVHVDGALVAFAQLRDCPPGDGVVGADPVELWRFYVDRHWQGRGLGRTLMDGVERAARARGADTLWLGVWERNLRAQAFYRRLGFSEVGTQIFQLGSDPQRDLIMAKRI